MVKADACCRKHGGGTSFSTRHSIVCCIVPIRVADGRSSFLEISSAFRIPPAAVESGTTLASTCAWIALHDEVILLVLEEEQKYISIEITNLMKQYLRYMRHGGWIGWREDSMEGGY